MFDKKEFWELFTSLTSLANEGCPKVDFYEKVAKTINSYCGVDCVSLQLFDDPTVQIRMEKNAEEPTTIRNTASTRDNFEITAALQQFLKQANPETLKKSPPYFLIRQGGAVQSNIEHPAPIDEKELFSTKNIDNWAGPYQSSLVLPVLTSDLKSLEAFLVLSSADGDYFTSPIILQANELQKLLEAVISNWSNSWALHERIKELTCLYQIAHLLENTNSSLSDLFMGVIEVIPAAWLYASSARAKIVFDGMDYASLDYPESGDSMRADILVQNKSRGFVEVSYVSKKPRLDEGPFLKEERKLLEIIAKELSIIAESKVQTSEMVQLKEQLQHANRLSMTGQIAAAVAHELNEPLTNILGFAQLAVKQREIPESVKSDLDKITNISLHAREVVRRLLMFSRKMPSNAESVDLNKTVEDSLSFLRHRCLKQGINLEFKSCEQPIIIKHDAGQIKQVIFNLVLNSIHASNRDGKITVSTSRNNHTAIIEVNDTGQGMPPAVLEKIFIPFYSTKDAGRGTGLGLSVVKEIVESYQGNIYVTSDVGIGTNVRIELNDSQSAGPGKCL